MSGCLHNTAHKLHTKSIISRDILEKVTDQKHNASLRTMTLLDEAEEKIRSEPHAFTEFVKILEESTLRSEAEKLVETYLKKSMSIT